MPQPPGGVPDSVARLNEELKRMRQLPEVRARLPALGAELCPAFIF